MIAPVVVVLPFIFLIKKALKVPVIRPVREPNSNSPR